MLRFSSKIEHLPKAKIKIIIETRPEDYVVQLPLIQSMYFVIVILTISALLFSIVFSLL